MNRLLFLMAISWGASGLGSCGSDARSREGQTDAGTGGVGPNLGGGGTGDAGQTDAGTGGVGPAAGSGGAGDAGQTDAGTGGVGPAGSGGAGGARWCSLVDCRPIWDVRRALPTALSISELQQLRVKVCRNDWCFEASLADFVPPERLQSMTGTAKVLPRTADSDPYIQVRFWGTNEGKVGEVEVVWEFRNPGSAAGDVFFFDLGQPNQTSVLRIEETVDYETYYPNGDGCEPRCQRTIARATAM